MNFFYLKFESFQYFEEWKMKYMKKMNIFSRENQSSHFIGFQLEYFPLVCISVVTNIQLIICNGTLSSFVKLSEKESTTHPRNLYALTIKISIP